MAPLLNSSKYSNERRFDVCRKEEEGERKKAMQNYVLGLSIILYIEHRVHISSGRRDRVKIETPTSQAGMRARNLWAV